MGIAASLLLVAPIAPTGVLLQTWISISTSLDYFEITIAFLCVSVRCYHVVLSYRCWI